MVAIPARGEGKANTDGSQNQKLGSCDAKQGREPTGVAMGMCAQSLGAMLYFDSAVYDAIMMV